MPSELKILMEKELEALFPATTDIVAVTYSKITSNEMSQLRAKLRGRGIRMTVVKNSIAARVLAANGVSGADQLLNGPTAFLAGKIEMPEVCKVATECAKTYDERLVIRGAVMDCCVLNARMVTQLASIPPMPVLHAKIAGSMQAPIVGVAYAFQSVLRSLGCALEGIRKQKEEASPSNP